MTQEKFSKSLAKSEVDGLFSDNPDGLRKLIENLCQEILQKEITEYLQAGWHERTPGRNGQRNGYKSRSIKTRVGEIKRQYFAEDQCRTYFPESGELLTVSYVCIKRNSWRLDLREKVFKDAGGGTKKRKQMKKLLNFQYLRR